jgi:hypothetical protein
VWLANPLRCELKGFKLSKTYYELEENQWSNVHTRVKQTAVPKLSGLAYASVVQTARQRGSGPAQKNKDEKIRPTEPQKNKDKKSGRLSRQRLH